MTIKYTNVNTKVRAMYEKTFQTSDYEELLRQTSVKSCLMLLKSKEEYEEPLQDIKDEVHRGALEKILQNLLEKDIERILALLNKEDKKIIKQILSKELTDEDNKIDIVGLRADILNILSIYRAKKYYHLNKDETKQKLIPIKFRLSKEIINKMCEQTDISDLLHIIDSTNYGRIFIVENEDLIEKRANEHLYKYYKEQLRQGKQTLSTILAYIYLRKIEIRNIINIIEGARYKVELNKTKEKLVM
ncbi:MAG: V-type ATPase subunit [Oscillospiraceae bacterium]|nr:V-type ATPase subunit [Oscillospiraceae bacterium]